MRSGSTSRLPARCSCSAATARTTSLCSGFSRTVAASPTCGTSHRACRRCRPSCRRRGAARGLSRLPTGSCRRVPAVQGRASAMAAVTVRNIRKSFGDLEVIHGIDLNIEDGSFVVLLGPSGCGKSTLLRMIAGLEPISAGEISIGGRVVNDLHPKDRDIAMVFQNYALYAHMSVFDNMAFSMQLKKMPQAEIKKRVDWAASILDLTSYLRSEEHTSELQSQSNLVCRLLLEKKNNKKHN